MFVIRYSQCEHWHYWECLIRQVCIEDTKQYPLSGFEGTYGLHTLLFVYLKEIFDLLNSQKVYVYWLIVKVYIFTDTVTQNIFIVAEYVLNMFCINIWENLLWRIKIYRAVKQPVMCGRPSTAGRHFIPKISTLSKMIHCSDSTKLFFVRDLG